MQSVLSRLALGVLTAAALVLIAGVFLPWWVGSERSLAHVAGMLYREVLRGESLDDRDERVRRCLEAKMRITDELLAGRRNLAEAAEAFREVSERVKGDDTLPERYRFADEEAVCRNVIEWARHRTEDDPQHQSAVVGRLEEELRQLRQARAAGAL